MSAPDPTGPGHAVALCIPFPDADFLRRAFTNIQAGLLEDLADFPNDLRSPERSRREAEAFGRLLAALDNGVIVPDPDVLDALREAAHANDEANEYERIVFEHRAYSGLLAQIEPLGDQR